MILSCSKSFHSLTLGWIRAWVDCGQRFTHPPAALSWKRPLSLHPIPYCQLILVVVLVWLCPLICGSWHWVVCDRWCLSGCHKLVSVDDAMLFQDFKKFCSWFCSRPAVASETHLTVCFTLVALPQDVLNLDKSLLLPCFWLVIPFLCRLSVILFMPDFLAQWQ